jgi:hypothetical protein
MTDEQRAEMILTLDIEVELNRHQAALLELKKRSFSSHLNIIINDSVAFVSQSLEEL